MDGSNTSFHYRSEREQRDCTIQAIGLGNAIESVLVDRGHQDGPERHTLTDTGIIIIENAVTGKLVTELIARPEQVRRIYELVGKVPPRKVMRKAYAHNLRNLNNT